LYSIEQPACHIQKYQHIDITSFFTDSGGEYPNDTLSQVITGAKKQWN